MNSAYKNNHEEDKLKNKLIAIEEQISIQDHKLSGLPSLRNVSGANQRMRIKISLPDHYVKEAQRNLTASMHFFKQSERIRKN